MTTTFRVIAERGDGVWVLECLEVGAVSQTRRLDRAANEMREAIAWQSGLRDDEVEVVVEPVMPREIAELKDRADALRDQADMVSRDAVAARRATVACMRAHGFSVRDIGSVLGISYQRAAKLAADA